MATPDEAADLATRLLDAHVAHELGQLLDPQAFESAIVEEVDRFLAMADTLTLSQAVDPEPVQAVARKYAAQVPVEGAIPELVGEIARLLYRHGVNDEYRFSDLIGDRQFDELTTAVGELGVVRRIVRRVLSEPSTVDTAVEMVTRAVDAALEEPEAAGEPSAAELSAWLRSRVGRGARGLARSVRPVIDGTVERVTRTGAAIVLRGNESDAEGLLVDAAREVWRTNRDEPVGAYRDLVAEEDVDDIVVLVFEFWREFRNTAFLRTLLDEGVGYVFDKYGDTPLTELLGEVGVFRADLIEEGLRFGPPVIARLHERGFLDEVVRHRLAGFYQSPRFRAAFEEGQGPVGGR
ncbi:hypothetical protein [Gordonia crocea]|uniref:Uncharacterized protein n=1 Tax=Gordonia crocea TaxID=589162 RepID=A0A7I9UYM0_9ACTN|nr:hypothetical protein [Gordonia crocea]GED97996.1 hypothetical protein nbrc107697_20350 [Gordonia crocea]